MQSSRAAGKLCSGTRRYLSRAKIYETNLLAEKNLLDRNNQCSCQIGQCIGYLIVGLPAAEKKASAVKMNDRRHFLHRRQFRGFIPSNTDVDDPLIGDLEEHT